MEAGDSECEDEDAAVPFSAGIPFAAGRRGADALSDEALEFMSTQVCSNAQILELIIGISLMCLCVPCFAGGGSGGAVERQRIRAGSLRGTVARTAAECILRAAVADDSAGRTEGRTGHSGVHACACGPGGAVGSQPEGKRGCSEGSTCAHAADGGTDSGRGHSQGGSRYAGVKCVLPCFP